MADDKRFSGLARDPKYRSMPRRLLKTRVDSRFSAMFTDERFVSKASVDKWGRPVVQTSSGDLHEFYDKDSDSDQTGQSVSIGGEVAEGSGDVEKAAVVSEESEEEGGAGAADSAVQFVLDRARGGGGSDFSDSSSDEDDEEEGGQGQRAPSPEHAWAELDADAERLDEDAPSTHRLALCNVDWDRVRANDIMVLLSSFAPTGGCVRSVHVFPSEYGLRRMAEEDECGPSELRTSSIAREDSASSGEDDDQDEGLRMERVREYQISRLRYFYAIVECDSAATADVIYRQCDGLEFESSASRLDLRFVPDHVSFGSSSDGGGSTPVARDRCLELPAREQYQPPEAFVTTALQQRRVRLTWDETDVGRQAALRRATQAAQAGNLDSVDVTDYLAPSSSEEEHQDDDTGTPLTDQQRIDTYRKLLLQLDQEQEQTDKHQEMEFTWGVDSDEERSTSRRPAPKVEPSESGSVDEDKERQTLSLLTMDAEDNSRHFNFDKIVEENTAGKRKRKRLLKRRVRKQAEGEDGAEEVDSFTLNVNDNRFSQLYTSPLFNVDPSNPMFRSSDGMQQLISEKQRRLRCLDERQQGGVSTAVPHVDKPTAAYDDISLLVHSIKSRAKLNKRLKL